MIVAIDPGVSGGIVSMSYNGVIQCHNMPDTYADTWDLIAMLRPEPGIGLVGDAYLEEVSGYAGGPGAPGSRMFTFGASYGDCRTALYGNGFRIHKVRPLEWQKHLGIGNRGTDKAGWKRKLKQKAQELFPGVKVTLKNADALLILHTAKNGLLK